MNCFCRSALLLKPSRWEGRRAVGETISSPLNLRGCFTIWGQHVQCCLPFSSVSLLYPFVNPAVEEEPLQINSPQHISPPPEEHMFCEVKGINIDLSRRGEKGRTFAFIQLSLQQLSTWLGKFPSHLSMDSPLSKPPFTGWQRLVFSANNIWCRKAEGGDTGISYSTLISSLFLTEIL